jgi:hypothetical protein
LEADLPKIITRRNVLIGAGAVGVVAATGGAWIATADAKAELLVFFKRALPGVTIDEASALRSIEEFTAQWSRGRTMLVSAAWRVAGVERMSAMQDRFDLAARRALTYFLTNSNFFEVPDPRKETIVFVARPAGSPCINPFANLDLRA